MNRATALTLALLLGACGFHPLYGGLNGGMSATLSTIYVEPVPDRIGYELRNTMIQSLFPPTAAALRAGRPIASNSRSVRRRKASRCRMTQPSRATTTRLTVTYELTDMAGVVVTKGTETGLSAYNVLPSAANANYGTLAAQQDADKRAARDIAERIRLDLNVYFVKR